MWWSRFAVVLGALLLALGFYVGTETAPSTTVAGDPYDCAAVIHPGWLVPGSPAVRAGDARVTAACAPLEKRAARTAWGSLALGGLLVLVGLTAVRERSPVAPDAEGQNAQL